MEQKAINFEEKFKLFGEQWSPKIIAQMNNYQFKVVKIQDNFVWHKHDQTDEVFIIIDGEVRIDFRDGSVTLKKNEMFVIPKGIEHKPYSEFESKIILIEPEGVVNTGDNEGAMTAESDVWI
ncbi:Cupin domain protein [Leuconostoc suionicum]|uniref:Cupin domain protein n=1 Tax=Leuconostoc suionicum TaxID=1511761 RepID=A0A2N9K863_9LACO|nr:MULTISPECIES: cupin domain-containing protein [Leuconostoc]MCT4402884.1 cupin domain-containing protein [Leuconostoc suionicum]SPD91547.1 Cupin domain protein [Leuconostoc suionicum]SPE06772.1 Cupin domain protein [Leuconostoc suionicum]SPH03279.1 Cupin domain protein [Leuconostoc suionicum]